MVGPEEKRPFLALFGSHENIPHGLTCVNTSLWEGCGSHESLAGRTGSASTWRVYTPAPLAGHSQMPQAPAVTVSPPQWTVAPQTVSPGKPFLPEAACQEFCLSDKKGTSRVSLLVMIISVNLQGECQSNAMDAVHNQP